MTRIVDPVLEHLREMVLRMGGLAEAILHKALDAVRERDPERAAEVERDDLEIDRLDVAIDEAVLKALALQAPVARDLRQVIAVKTMATDLERVGDLARNIAKSAVRLSEHPPVPPSPRLLQLADECIRILRDALDAFADADADKARRVLDDDDPIDRDESAVFQEAVDKIQAHPEISVQEVELILVGKNLERVADHATNIAEDVVLVTDAENLKHAAKLARERAGS